MIGIVHLQQRNSDMPPTTTILPPSRVPTDSRIYCLIGCLSRITLFLVHLDMTVHSIDSSFFRFLAWLRLAMRLDGGAAALDHVQIC